MVAANIKKIVIPKNDLPPISAEDNAYYVRFRAVEGLRYSHWSPVNFVAGITAPAIASDKVSIAVNTIAGSNKTVTAVWSPPAAYDIDTVYVYVKWTDHLQPTLPYEWQYVAKVSSTTYATVVPALVELTSTVSFIPTRVEIAVQVPTYPKVISAEAKLFMSDIKTL